MFFPLCQFVCKLFLTINLFFVVRITRVHANVSWMDSSWTQPTLRLRMH
jgi:hypothetical protein